MEYLYLDRYSEHAASPRTNPIEINVPRCTTYYILIINNRALLGLDAVAIGTERTGERGTGP